MLEEMEDRTNRVLWEGRPVAVRYLDEGEAAQAGLRKKVERDGPVRVIEVEGVDRCACGGTHVAQHGRRSDSYPSLVARRSAAARGSSSCAVLAHCSGVASGSSGSTRRRGS